MQRSTMVCVSPSDFIFAELILWSGLESEVEKY